MTPTQLALEGLFVPIESVEPHPSNPRLGDITAIAQSLERFGQMRPIVVQKSSGYIVAGNHTFLAAQGLGWTHIAAVNVDLSDDDAKRYMLADNRTSDKGLYDDEALIGLLQLMMDTGLLDGTGYTPDDVDDLIADVGVIAETAPQDFKGSYNDTDEERQRRTRDYTDVQPMREIILLYTVEDFEQVSTDIKGLRKLWGIESTRGVVKEAITRAVTPPPLPRTYLEAPGTVAAVTDLIYPKAEEDGVLAAAREEVAHYLKSLATVVEETKASGGEGDAAESRPADQVTDSEKQADAPSLPEHK